MKDRFIDRLSVKIISELEELLLCGVKGNCMRCEELFVGEGFAMHEPTIDADVLKRKFRYVSMSINQNEVVSFPTLVSELNKQDTECLWLAGKNFMTLVKMMLCVMPTSISAERSFSVLDRVKTKLRNSMGDERMSNLVMLSFYPEMASSIDIASLRNKFVPKHNTLVGERSFLENLWRKT